jgi:hypothetical protein
LASRAIATSGLPSSKWARKSWKRSNARRRDASDKEANSVTVNSWHERTQNIDQKIAQNNYQSHSSVWRFANYLDIFLRGIWYMGAHFNPNRSQGFRRVDQLFCYSLQSVDLENSQHLRSTHASVRRKFLPVTWMSAYAKYRAKLYAK